MTQVTTSSLHGNEGVESDRPENVASREGGWCFEWYRRQTTSEDSERGSTREDRGQQALEQGGNESKSRVTVGGDSRVSEAEDPRAPAAEDAESSPSGPCDHAKCSEHGGDRANAQGKAIQTNSHSSPSGPRPARTTQAIEFEIPKNRKEAKALARYAEQQIQSLGEGREYWMRRCGLLQTEKNAIKEGLAAERGELDQLRRSKVLLDRLQGEVLSRIDRHEPAFDEQIYDAFVAVNKRIGLLVRGRGASLHSLIDESGPQPLEQYAKFTWTGSFNLGSPAVAAQQQRLRSLLRVILWRFIDVELLSSERPFAVFGSKLARDFEKAYVAAFDGQGEWLCSNALGGTFVLTSPRKNDIPERQRNGGP